MRSLTKLALAAGAVVLLGGTAACSDMMMNGGDHMASGGGAMEHGAMASNPMVGGAAMYANKNIIQNAVNSKDHTTLVAAVKAAGLVDTLSGPGPFTVFAPTNEAFDKLPPGTVGTLVKPENHDTLVKILTYHVVPGTMTSAMLTDGKVLTTVQGEPLTVHKHGGVVTLTDAKGGTSTVTIADVMQSNGVIHVVDTVLMP